MLGLQPNVVRSLVFGLNGHLLLNFECRYSKGSDEAVNMHSGFYDIQIECKHHFYLSYLAS